MPKSFYVFMLNIGVVFLLTQCQEAPTTQQEKIPADKIEKKASADKVPTEQKVDTSALIVEEIPKTLIDTTDGKAKQVATNTATTTERKTSPKKVEKKANKKVKKRAKIKFDELVHKFGNIKTGDKVNHKFKFKNTGNAPLVIKNVDVSCGCTFPSYPFLPIEPGKEGTIEVTFDSEHKVGRQKPTVTVVTNGRPRIVKLNLEGFVE